MLGIKQDGAATGVAKYLDVTSCVPDTAVLLRAESARRQIGMLVPLDVPKEAYHTKGLQDLKASTKFGVVTCSMPTAMREGTLQW